MPTDIEVSTTAVSRDQQQQQQSPQQSPQRVVAALDRRDRLACSIVDGTSEKV